MIPDLIIALILVFALYRGYTRGLIVGLFSFIAVFIGLAAALKLSSVVAKRIGGTVKVSQEWLPFLSFLLVFLVVVLLIWLGARVIRKTVQLAMMGWVDKLGGMIFYAAMYLLVISVLLFYAEKMELIKPETLRDSYTYTYVRPWGQKAIDAFGNLLPVFKDMFDELGDFFESVSKRISSI